MLIVLAVILSIGFGGWLAWRAVKGKPIKVHLVMYGLTVLAGIYTLVFFMRMDILQIVKVLVAIVLGGVLIFWAARQQRRGREQAGPGPGKSQGNSGGS